MREVFSDVIVKCVFLTSVLLFLVLLLFILVLYIFDKIEEREMKKNEIGRKNM